jgi:hypothetical protein
MRTRSLVLRAGVLLVFLGVLLSAGCGGPTVRSRARPAPDVVRSSPGPATPVVIDVFGTPGTRFGGSYGEVDNPKSFEGAVPARLTFEYRRAFSIALQKRGPAGELGMQVTVNGKPVERVATTKSFGVVTYKHGIASP